MLATSLSVVLGVVYLLVGIITVLLIFQASTKLKDKGANSWLVQGHRIGGYVFILLFCVISYFMIIKIKDLPDELALRPMIHMLLAMLLVPLMFIKVLVARYYKTYYSVLMPLGLIIFSISFVIVTMAVGPYFLRKATIKDVPLEAINLGTNKIDLEAAQALMQKKCSKCHALDRVVGVQKDPKGWLASVNRMRALPGSAIDEKDVSTIVSYLVSQNPNLDEKGQMTAKGMLEAGKSLVETRCNKCHDLDRTYKATKTLEEWQATVGTMVGYAQGNSLFKPGDDQTIINFLSKTQTPQAVKEKTELVSKASSSANASMSSEVKPLSSSNNRDKEANFPISTSGLIAVLFGGTVFGFLMYKRPGKPALDNDISLKEISDRMIKNRNDAFGHLTNSATISRNKISDSDNKKDSITLKLSRVKEETHNTKTLRFALPLGESFAARPGQFLTFNWMIDGKKVVRSYSISSSPTQIGYVEITVKRADEGYVSVFLNDVAEVGLTVDAKGASGQFYFDETKHKKLVLIAAGSGITPMISILRYIEDRGLSTDATLIYSVATSKDIIFETEFVRLKENLNNFHSTVTVTKPTNSNNPTDSNSSWNGTTGRVSRALIEANVKDLSGSTFFICGPNDFTKSIKEILLSLEVEPEQIKIETFGGKALALNPSSLEVSTLGAALATEPELLELEISSRNNTKNTVEFSRSNKTCTIPKDKTILEIAEMNGVAIPFSCRQGQCGTCVTRLIKGQVSMETENGLDPVLKREGYILTCVTQADTDISLDV
jgi:ferredoxin-NADP reductase/mono/diheme cytochrome c family protein